MNNCKLYGKALVVQLTRDEMRVALMQQRSDAPQILDSVILPLPQGAVFDGMIQNKDEVRLLLKQAISRKPFSSAKRVIFALSTNSVISETVIVPDVPDAQLERLLNANMDLYFPINSEDYELVWQVVSPHFNENGQKEKKVQLWAVPNHLIRQYYHLANACELSVLAIDYSGHSLASAAGAVFTLPQKAKKSFQFDLNMEIGGGSKEMKREKELADLKDQLERIQLAQMNLYLNIEQDSVTVTFIQGGHVRHQRMIQCSNAFDSITEVSMALEYFTSTDPEMRYPDRVLVSGAYATDEDLCNELATALGIDVYHATKPEDLIWFTCLGAAKTNLDFGIPSLSDVESFPRRLLAHSWQYAVFGISILILVAAYFQAYTEDPSSKTAMEQLEAYRLALMAQSASGKEAASAYQKYESLYNAYSNDWETVFGSIQTYNDNINLVLEELETVLPEDVAVTQMGISPEGITFEFASDSKERMAYTIMALRNLRYASIAGISNITGGGAGPSAPTYDSWAEHPPTEGSNTVYTDAQIYQNLQNNLTYEEEENLFGSLAILQGQSFTLAFEKYGAVAPTTQSTLEELSARATNMQRTNAIGRILSNNPWTTHEFFDLVKADYESPEKILVPLIMDDLLLDAMTDGGKMIKDIKNREIADVPTLLNYRDRILDMITASPDRVLATENLIKNADPNAYSAKAWYTYYLELTVNAPSSFFIPWVTLDYLAPAKLGPAIRAALNTTTPQAWAATGDDVVDAAYETYLQFEAPSEPTPTATPAPTPTPTPTPTVDPTATPTVVPTATPSATPTVAPTVTPSATPTVAPTVTPTATPTVGPTATPSATPTVGPTATPSATPTVGPTATPSATPTVVPTATPSATPTVAPTVTPTVRPTATPTPTPTPTKMPNTIPANLWQQMLETLGAPDKNVPPPTDIPDAIYNDAMDWGFKYLVDKSTPMPSHVKSWFIQYYISHVTLPTATLTPKPSNQPSASATPTPTKKPNAIPANLWQQMLNKLNAPDKTVPAPTNIPDDIYNATLNWYASYMQNSGTPLPSNVQNWFMNYYVQQLTGNKPPASGAPTPTPQPPDTRYFITIAFQYREDLIQAELVRRGLNYDDKLQKVEVDK